MSGLSYQLHRLLGRVIRACHRRGLIRRGQWHWTYWEDRQDFAYYALARDWIEELSPGTRIVDVGGFNTPVVLAGRFEERLVIDRRWVLDRKPGVRYVCRDYLRWPVEPVADVLLCLQVLEHLEDGEVELFARKLMQESRSLIVSVPYEWPADKYSGHPQDPIDHQKLIGWMGGRSPEREAVVEDGSPRLLMSFSGDAESRRESFDRDTMNRSNPR